jgi:hypothetical protein
MIFLNQWQFLPIENGIASSLRLNMSMSQPRKTQRPGYRSVIRLILAAGLCLFAGREALASDGYLKIVGPPPLRFESPETNTLLALKAVMLKPKPSVTENTDSMATNMVAPATNAMAVAATVTNPVAEVTAVTNQVASSVVTNTVDVNGVNNISGDSPSSARDLLPVTAQMITEYLKPTKGQNATNPADQPGATVFVPNQMGFTPPVMQNPPSVPESRAVYKSQ